MNLNHAPCLCYSTSDKGIVVDVNDAFCKHIGTTREELIGFPAENFYTISTRIFYQTHLFPLLKMQGSAEEIFVTLRTASKEDLPILLHIERREENGQMLCIFAGIVVRQRKRFEEELIAARKEAERALAENTALQQARTELESHTSELDRQLQILNRQNQELRQFSRVVTHDVQEPLRKLQVFVQMLLDEKQGSDAPRLLGKIGKATGQLRGIVAGLQQFVWLSEAVPKKTELELRTLVLLQVQKLIQEFPDLRLDWTVAESTTLNGDSEQMAWLFYEILSNALRFRKEGDVARVTIEADLVQQNRFRNLPEKYGYVDFLRIRVTDDGLGFDAQYSTQLFELFRKLHPNSGRGIGLALCKKIAEQHGGSIAIDSKKNVGTMVTVFLPVADIPQEQSTLLKEFPKERVT